MPSIASSYVAALSCLTWTPRFSYPRCGWRSRSAMVIRQPLAAASRHTWQLSGPDVAHFRARCDETPWFLLMRWGDVSYGHI
jgi:hypothetical protein